MKSIRYLAAAFAALCFASAALAGDPSGTWKWVVNMVAPRPPDGPGGGDSGGQRPPGGGQLGSREVTLTLALKYGLLTGSQAGPRSDTPITNAVYKNDVISFTVEREVQGRKIVAKYDGKLDGDTITGTIELPGRAGGEPRKIDWSATRAK